MEKDVKQEGVQVGGSKEKINKTLFVVMWVAFIAGLIALAIVFMPITILTGAVLYGSGDKRGLWGIIAGCVGLLLWYISLGV